MNGSKMKRVVLVAIFSLMLAGSVSAAEKHHEDKAKAGKPAVEEKKEELTQPQGEKSGQVKEEKAKGKKESHPEKEKAK